MGTEWSVRAVASQAALDALLPDIEALFAGIIAEMSNWEHYSAISRFNASAPGSWHVLPPSFFAVLTAALDVARESGGAFDPALGMLVDRWGFGPAGAAGTPPPHEVIAGLLGGPRWEDLRLDLAAQRAFQPGVALDFSGIAKGHAADRLAGLLREHGVRSFLAEIGGELVGEGIKPDGQPWWVDFEAPPGSDVPPIRAALHGLAIATSGDYRRFREYDGQSFAHTIDPRTGAPLVNGVASATVLHASCMMADAYATAVTVLGPDAGLRFADERGIACRWLVREDGGMREIVSPALAAMLG